jgi:hypothetical protein
MATANCGSLRIERMQRNLEGRMEMLHSFIEQGAGGASCFLCLQRKFLGHDPKHDAGSHVVIRTHQESVFETFICSPHMIS